MITMLTTDITIESWFYYDRDERFHVTERSDQNGQYVHAPLNPLVT